MYNEHRRSDILSKEEPDNEMITTFFNIARAYYRQQDWNMCLSMLAKSLDLVQKQKEEHFMLPELYYSMALAYAHRQEIPIALQYFKLTISTAAKKTT
ncbi:unnamed protein product [Rotaria magnacalcarata]